MVKQDLAGRFELYHRQHPQVAEAFERFASELLRAGRTRGSAAMIFERIRWETAVAGGQEQGLPRLKLNNNYRAFYARALMEARPEFKNFFETREQKALAPYNQPALAGNVPV